MRYFLDTEFIEAGHLQPVKLISLGLVAEDGRTYYAEVEETDLNEAGDWVKANVVPYLSGPRKPRETIAQELLGFCTADGNNPEFWGYFADYDWVLFAQVFGTMLSLPHGWPMMCMDVMQLSKHLGVSRQWFPAQDSTKHNALNDAVWTKQVYDFLDPMARSRGLYT